MGVPPSSPTRSRSLLAQSRRVRWGSSEDEARAYLQTRLTLFSKLMFWSFTMLLLFLCAMYWKYPEIKPHNTNKIVAGAVIGLAMMGLVWRVLLPRRALSFPALHWVDIAHAGGIGIAFGASAFFAPELHAAGYTSLIQACFMVFTRAILVPSSGGWTALMSTLTMIPVGAAAVGLALTTKQDLPTAGFIIGEFVLSIVAILLATIGSRTIYGLRRKFTEATQLGQYTLGRKIADGGMGSIYRAHHALLRRPTAVKLLQPDRVGAETLERFEREVQHMSQLTHPNTVAVFDYGHSPDGVFYYAMEYLGGIDLEELVRRHGPQPARRVIHILAQVCGALHEAHGHGITHRDIKPANIILCERGGMPDVAKVVDFGLAKEITADTGASSQVILGTPAYIAPEAITDPARTGPAADLYSVGAVAYFLLAGRRVFEGKTAFDVCMQHVNATPLPLAQAAAVAVPPELEAIVTRCLAKQPSERFASAAALADALRAVVTADDWSATKAKQWWAEYRAAEQPVVSATPTMTITIDVEHRT